jgi:shikimate kinase
MMGCGKSAIGPRLAERLARTFLDSDARVHELAGRSIPEIFRELGEVAFRVLESRVIEEAARGSGVVALGGGAIAQRGAAARLASLGTVVYLRAAPEQLLERLGDLSSRPLLAGLSRSECTARLAELLAQREQAYLSASIVVDTDGASVEEVAAEVARRFTAGSRSDPAGGAEAVRER